MKYLLYIVFFVVSSNLFAWDIVVKDGDAVCIDCESYTVYNSTTAEYFSVQVSSEPLTIVNNLKNEGFRGSRSKWIDEINKRMSENYSEKRRREYPSVGDQLDAIWKILLNNEDEDSNNIKNKISEIKAKYPKN